MSYESHRKQYCYSIGDETGSGIDDLDIITHKAYQRSGRESSLSTAAMRRRYHIGQTSDLQSNRDEGRVDFASFRAKNEKLSVKYGKLSRLAMIMSIKVKPSCHSKSKAERTKLKFQNCQKESSPQVRISTGRQGPSRFDKIMQIKVSKPIVCSTLVNYQPRKGRRLEGGGVGRRQSGALAEKQNRQRQQRSAERRQKELRQWRLQERQRGMDVKEKRVVEDRQYLQERRQENLFQGLVSKEIVKLQREREISKRKTQGFSPYVYPYY